jgi:iron-sulfur cluster insertion protein
MATHVELTSRAAQRVQEMIHEQGEGERKLRVFIAGGGCSGFQYGFCFEEQTEEDDAVMATGDVEVLVDPTSLAYLEGASIDYVEDVAGSRFVINNPNAKTTCGCGSSFSA